MVGFTKGQRKIDVMRPYLRWAVAWGCSRVAAIGVAQEYAQVTDPRTMHPESGYPRCTFGTAQPRVSCFYFSLGEEQMGVAFLKVSSYFPYPMKIWLNAHEGAKR